MLLRVARQRTWADAAETALRASPPDVAAKAREQGVLSADLVERLRIAAQIASDIYAAGDGQLGEAWLMVSTNVNDKSAIAIFAEKLESLA
ncbi:hypothetical protein MXD81_14150, partial [Microbacteriaceae bacterium K1510]|nr:hypothetical protein [Microbacteriaceae bacterium K1510]